MWREKERECVCVRERERETSRQTDRNRVGKGVGMMSNNLEKQNDVFWEAISRIIDSGGDAKDLSIFSRYL